MKIKLFFISFLILTITVGATEEFFTLSKATISSQQINSIEKAILFFWTTWCPYCRIQIETFRDLQYQLTTEGVKSFFVNLGESKEKVRRFKERLKIKSPVILDKKGLLAYKYRIVGIPTYIFLKKGKEIGRTNYITKLVVEKLYGE